MRKACSRIAWGIGIQLFDLNILGFDVLPDVLGNLLILLGIFALEAPVFVLGIALIAATLWLLALVSRAGKELSPPPDATPAA